MLSLAESKSPLAPLREQTLPESICLDSVDSVMSLGDLDSMKQKTRAVL
ncbi:hypothetical protein [uncultured Helicobacter sp.]